VAHKWRSCFATTNCSQPQTTNVVALSTGLDGSMSPGRVHPTDLRTWYHALLPGYQGSLMPLMAPTTATAAVRCDFAAFIHRNTLQHLPHGSPPVTIFLCADTIKFGYVAADSLSNMLARPQCLIATLVVDRWLLQRSGNLGRTNQNSICSVWVSV
jgi:hypothetical protein